MEDNNEEWVMVKPILDKDLWNPTSSSNETEKKDLKVRFNEAAKHWTDAVPVGNRRLGGMVWGGVSAEIINLNEETLWTGVPGNYTNPDAPNTPSDVRKLVDDGKYAESTKAAVKLSGDPSDLLHFQVTYYQITKISVSKSGSLSFTVSLDSKLHHHSTVNDQNQIIMEGSCPGRRKPPTLFF